MSKWTLTAFKSTTMFAGVFTYATIAHPIIALITYIPRPGIGELSATILTWYYCHFFRFYFPIIRCLSYEKLPHVHPENEHLLHVIFLHLEHLFALSPLWVFPQLGHIGILSIKLLFKILLIWLFSFAPFFLMVASLHY